MIWRRFSKLTKFRRFFRPRLVQALALIGIAGAIVLTFSFSASNYWQSDEAKQRNDTQQTQALTQPGSSLFLANGRPQLSPLPAPEETWNCEVAVIGDRSVG